MIRLPRTKRGLTSYIIAIALLTFSIFQTANSGPTKKIALSPSPTPLNTQTAVLGEKTETHKVIKVIDGDTFVIETNEKVRLIGVNAPETVDPRRKVECFGPEAAEYTKSQILDKEVQMVSDISDKDSFGRLLRYVYVNGIFLNKDLVLNGYAQVSTYPPDVTFQKDFKEAQSEAFLTQRGLWSTKCNL